MRYIDVTMYDVGRPATTNACGEVPRAAGAAVAACMHNQLNRAQTILTKYPRVYLIFFIGPYESVDSYGRYLPKVSDGVELAAAASSCM